MKVSRLQQFAHVGKALLRDTGALAVRNVIDFYRLARSEGANRFDAAVDAAIPATLLLIPATGGAFMGVPKLGVACSIASGVVMALTMADRPSMAFPNTAHALQANRSPVS